ncbi:hypothetical protein D3C87_231720 [compost metagenome]
MSLENMFRDCTSLDSQKTKTPTYIGAFLSLVDILNRKKAKTNPITNKRRIPLSIGRPIGVGPVGGGGAGGSLSAKQLATENRTTARFIIVFGTILIGCKSK